jgi:hypothetical protein
MRENITRREWVAALGVTTAAARAQTQPSASQSAADLMAEARTEVRQDTEQIGKFPLPSSAEPAFIFKP